MKYFTIAIIVLLTFALSSFSLSAKKEGDAVENKINEIYRANFQQFADELADLLSLCQKSPLQITRLKKQFLKTRLAYKKIEFLFDFHKTDFNHAFVNGPPLNKISDEFTDAGFIPPNGLQRIDELLFAEQLSPDDKEEIQMITADLMAKIDEVLPSHMRMRHTRRSTIQAMRSGMVRLFALGITGFDTPASGNALPEALASMRSMAKTFDTFGDDLQPQAQDLFLQIKQLFQKGQEQILTCNDFDTFDRMTFLKEVINPLYAKIFHFQKANKIPTGGFKFNTQNYRSENIFDEDFLNLEYYCQSCFLPLDNPKNIQLGKMLFHDPILSKNLDMSCATCHDPKKAFTDGLPKGITSHKGKPNIIHTPTTIDVAFGTRFFWDLRVYTLEQQVADVFRNPLEFNLSFAEAAQRLEQSEKYRQMFTDIYGGITKRPIKRRSITNAIAAYVNTLISFDSPFDKYVRNESDVLSEDAIRGFNLFMGKAACGTCHFVPTFSGLVPPFYMETESEVLGITLGLDTLNPRLDTIIGRFGNGKRKETFDFFKHSIKTVTLRNIELTAPYMHNGLFNTLEEVIEFYDKGGGAGMGLQVENQTLPAEPLQLSQQEKKDLIAFMHSLTDTTGLTDTQVLLPKIEGHPQWNERGTK